MDLNTLSSKLIKAIQDPLLWHEALGDLCVFTKTDRALISLRDKKDASIVIPDDVSEEFASPLIFGFSEAEVEAFLSDFGEVDPWTAIEKENYPYFPYCMSRYLPTDQLKQTEFWHWLQPMGISDSLVCEIGQTETYWAALNLYFEPENEDQVTAVLDRVKQVLPVLKSVWSTGRELQIAKSAADSMEIILSAIHEPAAMVSHDGNLIAQNVQMDAFMAKAGLAPQNKSEFALPSDLTIRKTKQSEKLHLRRSKASGSKGEVHIKAYKTVQFSDGENRDSYLLTIEQPASLHQLSGAEVWDFEALTPRERTLVKLAAEGLKFSEAQEEMGLSYPRIMQIWKSSRDKLGINDVNELRLAHKLKKA
ncbi:MAG: hypothetical protein JXQ85_07705 [Cognatishimia sp.]|uniref:helix-turn-helix transcriptional regulator n=1 Tax=Cognatishimia sp. TaxID=2211648 RepID=UPI003B8B8952